MTVFLSWIARLGELSRRRHRPPNYHPHESDATAVDQSRVVDRRDPDGTTCFALGCIALTSPSSRLALVTPEWTLLQPYETAGPPGMTLEQVRCQWMRH